MSMEKAIARHELTCETQDVVRAVDHLLVPYGSEIVFGTGPGGHRAPGKLLGPR
ncbi:hypothetical protein [Myxococcus xanthus]|uniref:Uncharacterized protein n=1 Tax=Myxococcus xanthus TaxID=34 RepID=A0A7Y4MUP1_MYXXA|nr:hypothetical protein [Myxococcus xanthus]NOJ82904.1 hypothetical protein [Myxococcus xanthus]NOJ90186.1 hypothetical protein [Myxococcus xanthus]